MKTRNKIPWLILMVLTLVATLAVIVNYFVYSSNKTKLQPPGLLSINTNKPVYLAGEQVFFQIASLDYEGKTLCNSNLVLRVKNNNFGDLEEPVEVAVNSTCSSDNNATNEPDYTAYYLTKSAGTLQAFLTNLDSGQTDQIEFQVTDTVPPIQIERWGALRLNPLKEKRYPMVIRLTAHEDYEGIITDRLPPTFDFAWYGPARIETVNGEKIIFWEVKLEAGQELELKYDYLTEERENHSFTLGPIQANGQEIVNSLWVVTTSP